MLYLILIFSILFIGLTWFRPLLAIQLTLFSLPAYLIRFKVGVPMTLLEVMILINFTVWLVKSLSVIKTGIKNRLAKKPGVIEYPFGVEMILVLIAGLIGVGVAGLSNEALGIWKAYFFEPVLLLIVIYQVVGRLEVPLEEKFKTIIWPLILSGLAVSSVAIYQKATGQLIANPLWAAAETRRVVSVFGYPNAVGLFLESIVVYAFSLIFLVRAEQVKKHKLILLVMMHLLILPIVFAKSVGAMLGLAAGFALFLIAYSKESRKAFLVGFAVALVIVMATPAGRGKFEERLLFRDFSGQVRLIGWQETWQMLKAGNLLTGVGLSGFQQAVEPFHVPGFYFNKDKDPDFQRKLLVFNQSYRDKYWQPLEIYMYPHNIVLNFWSEVGLIGLLMFTWLISRFYYLSARYLTSAQGNRRLIILASVSAMTTIIVHGLVDVPFFKNDLAVLFWLPIVFVGLYQIELKKASLENNN